MVYWLIVVDGSWWWPMMVENHRLMSIGKSSTTTYELINLGTIYDDSGGPAVVEITTSVNGPRSETWTGQRHDTGPIWFGFNSRAQLLPGDRWRNEHVLLTDQIVDILWNTYYAKPKLGVDVNMSYWSNCMYQKNIWNTYAIHLLMIICQTKTGHITSMQVHPTWGSARISAVSTATCLLRCNHPRAV